MLPTHTRVAAHAGFEIWLRQPGLEFTPIMLGKIASFLIHGPDGRIGSVACMYSLLLLLDEKTPPEEQMLAEAIAAIERLIDEQLMTDHFEATFEYHSGRWVAVNNPRWWIPTFG